MSVNITASGIDATYEDDDDHSQGSGQSEEDNKDLENFDDWVDEDDQKTKSLFEDKLLDSALACVAYDREHHGLDILAISSKLGLDFLQRIRLINYIRKENVLPLALATITKEDPILSDDKYLQPVLENDPLLQLDSGDWSEDEDNAPQEPGPSTASGSLPAAQSRIKRLESQLSESRQETNSLRSMIAERLDSMLERTSPTARRGPLEPKDDDSHYFNSYSYNEIHAVMIQDTVRTSSYQRFIMGNPTIFRDAVVLDVGCGTGILSMFAARAGARRVFAIDASDIVEKARRNVAENNLEHIITVIHAKIEDLPNLPGDTPYVDIIISEWMGYCCIYESMLDSVLIARDKFLRKDGTVITEEEEGEEPESTTLGQGLMVPSQCRMELALGDANEVIRERVKFWDDVYGFHMTAMGREVYDECVMNIVAPEAMLSEPTTVKDIQLQHITIRSLDFHSPFKLTATRSGELNAFILYFDTFFTTDGKDLAPDAQVSVHKDDFAPGEVLRVGERRTSDSAPGDERRRSVDASARRKKSSVDLRPSAGNGSTASAGGNDDRTRTQLSGSPVPIETPLVSGGPIAPPLSNSPSTGPTSILSKRPTLSQGGPSRRESIGAGLPKSVSFSTGPRSMPTHWKQGIFLLRKPVRVRKGTTVTGSFHCRKSEGNSRELDVEIHYLVEDPAQNATETPAPTKEAVVQMYKVR